MIRPPLDTATVIAGICCFAAASLTIASSRASSEAEGATCAAASLPAVSTRSAKQAAPGGRLPPVGDPEVIAAFLAISRARPVALRYYRGMIALNAADILRLLRPVDTVGLVEAAALAARDPECVVPARQHIRWPGGTLLTMPAIAPGVMSVKLVSVVPGNTARELPVTNGLLVLSDGRTGLPLALLNAAALTAVRTGAVGALGVKYTSPADTSSLGVVGTGIQGAWVAISACAVRPVRTVFAVRRSAASFAAFEKTLAEHAAGVRVIPCANAAELLSRTALIVTATTSAVPVLPDEAPLLEGRHFIAIGSYEKHMRELPDSVFRLSGHLVLDSEFARHEVGEAVVPVEQGILTEASVFTIGDLVAGRRTLDITHTTVYKSAGMALFDLYVARALHEAARRRGVGQEVML